MNFAEARFWGLLFTGLASIALLRFVMQLGSHDRRDVFDRAALTVLGLFLLLCVSWVTFIIFMVVAVITYAGLEWVLQHSERRQRACLFLLNPLQLLPLVYYKYADFGFNQVMGCDLPWVRHLIIPVGISFYSFQQVGFVIDTLVYRQPLPRFLDCLNFIGFFPQIVAGPIERRADLLPQMEKFRFRWLARDINEGVGWIVIGLFFKLCLADNLAEHFSRTSASNAYLIWLANLIFGLRIYYDFAGYSLIALGLGRCLGVRLTLNFCSPYCATSIAEFWRRWHVTLSQWFRDYVYIPLGGGRVRWWALNIAVVFVVSGLWHGAGWNFVLWGALHGAALIVNRIAGPKLKLPNGVGWLLTMIVAFFAWLGFYETRTDVLGLKIKALLTLQGYNHAALGEAAAVFSSANGFVMCCFLALSALSFLLEWLSVLKKDEPYYLLRRPVILIGLVLLTVVLAEVKSNEFIYFAF